MKKFLMPVAIAGAGKSTLARGMAKINKNLRIVSSDDIREELFGSAEDQQQYNLVFATMEKRAIFLLKIGYDVFFDSTNIERKYREATLRRIREAVPDVFATALLLRVPVEDAIRQDAGRSRKVPESVIRSMAERLEEPTFEEGFDFIEVVD